MNKHVYLRNVATLKVDENKCSGCGVCLDVCPHEVLTLNDRRIRIQDLDACMECGACSRNCPAAAITVCAGVGCAAAVINGMLGRSDSACCCTVDPDRASGNGDRQRCC